MAISDQIQEGIINLAEQSLNQTTPRSGGLRSLIIDPTQVDPQVDITGLRTATDTSPQLLAQAPDFQGVKFDPTSYDYISDLYELYSGGLPILDTPATTTDTAQIPGAVDTLVNVGGQGQGTGGTTDPITDPTLDTTFQDAGAVDTPGTIGTLGNLTTPTTIDQVDYTDAPITVPALDLSGTSTDLINQGVIETPQEFYGRTYNTSPSNYELLDNEEQLVVDQQYATAYGLAPVPEKALTAGDVIGKLPSVQIVKGAVDLFTPDESVSSTMAIDPNTGLFAAGDPGVDAAENEFANIQDTPLAVTTADPISTALTLGAGQTLDDIGEIDTPQVQTPAEQIFDQGDGIMDDDPFQDDPVSSPAPAPDAVTGDSGSDDQGETSSDAGFSDSPDFGGYDSGGYDPAPSPVDDPTDRGGAETSSGKGVVCTMMNETYGFGSFRNKIWIKYAQDNFTPEYEKGYHKIFLPLVSYAKKKGVTNKIVKKILEHIAVHRTIDIRQESRGKTHMLGRIYRKILEPICYWVGKYAKR